MAGAYGRRLDGRSPGVAAAGRLGRAPPSSCDHGAMPRGDGLLSHDLLPGEKGPQDACGVFGVWAPEEDVAKLTYFGLYALQHRGQESAGICVSNGSQLLVLKDMGLVSQVFDERSLAPLQGHLAIGHTRYSTTGASQWENAQPTLGNTAAGTVALGHNGNLTNTAELRDLVEQVYGRMTRGEMARGNTTDTVAHHHAAGRLARPHPGGHRARGAAEAARRLLAGVHGRAHPLRGARPARHPAAGAGPAGARLGGRVGDRRARHRGCVARPRDRAGRAGDDRRERPAHAAFRRPDAHRLRLRVRVPRPPRHHDRRSRRARRAGRDGTPARRGAPRGRRPRHPHPGVRHAGGDRVRGGVRDPVRPGPGQERLRRDAPSSSRPRPSASSASGSS